MTWDNMMLMVVYMDIEDEDDNKCGGSQVATVASSWPSKWPMTEAHLFVVPAFFI